MPTLVARLLLPRIAVTVLLRIARLRRVAVLLPMCLVLSVALLPILLLPILLLPVLLLPICLTLPVALLACTPTDNSNGCNGPDGWVIQWVEGIIACLRG